MRYGLNRDKDWWQDLKKRGLENISKIVKESLWELLSDSNYAKNLSEAERSFIFTHFANATFDLKLTASSSPEEASTLIAEKILEASYKSRPGDELHEYYSDWMREGEWEESLHLHAEKFSKVRKEELLSNIELFEDDYKHPFTVIEKELFDRRIQAILQEENAAQAIEFAKERRERERRETRTREAESTGRNYLGCNRSPSHKFLFLK